MDKFQFYFIAAVIAAIIGFAIYYYIFNIYEVTYSVNPKNLFADYKSTVILKAVPINALGFKAPFRFSHTFFSISEGDNLVDVVKDNEAEGIFILRAKDKAGKVVVRLKSDYSLLPTLITIFIYPNYASTNNF